MTIHRVTITYIGYRVNVKEHNHYNINICWSRTCLIINMYLIYKIMRICKNMERDGREISSIKHDNDTMDDKVLHMS